MVTRRLLVQPLCALAAAILVSCGGDDGASNASPSTIASLNTVSADAPVAGVTPFIAFTTLHSAAMGHVKSAQFSIVKKLGTVSKPVSATYSIDYLQRRGFATAGGTTLNLPIFGLYAAATNLVSVTLTFDDDSTSSLLVNVATAAYVDPNGINDHGSAVQARAADGAIGFDFFFMKATFSSPVVVDTDGNVRWVGAGIEDSFSTTPVADGFEIGDATSGQLHHVSFDGNVDSSATLALPGVADFHHDMEPGKTGFFGSVDTDTAFESTVVEFAPDGSLISQWLLGDILSAYMSANGDDPTAFVRPDVDWFHNNTEIYDARDDSILISSRENFVIKLDYATQEIRWIFGDTSKYWYTFPSLRAKSLTFLGDGLVPVGQHSLSITPDGNLMLFNNGTGSLNEPAGQPAGIFRSYAAVSSYVIDETARTATEAWHFDHDQTYPSPFCSSARSSADGSVLIDYAVMGGGTLIDIVGLDPAHNIVFDYRYPAVSCALWYAEPIAFDALVID